MRRAVVVAAGMSIGLGALVAAPAQAIDPVITVNVGLFPHDVAFAPDGGTIYAPAGGKLYPIDAATNAVGTPIALGTDTGDVVVTPDGGRAYVAGNAENKVFVVNIATSSVVASIPVAGQPYGLAMSPDGSTVLVTQRIAAKVTRISTSTNTVTGSLAVGNNPAGVAISPDGTRAVVANSNTDNATVINLPAFTVASTVSLTSAPYGVTMDAAGNAYVSAQFGGNVAKIGPSNTVTTTIPVPGGPVASAPSRDGSTLYVTEYNANKLASVRLANSTITSETASGAAPIAAAVSPDGSRIAVANFNSASISIYSAAPATTTTAATSVMADTATGNGQVQADTNAVTSARCYYGTNAEQVLQGPNGTAASVSATPGTVASNASSALTCPFTGLTPGTNYTYVVAATDSDGTGWATTGQSFLTRPGMPSAPSVTRKKTSLKFTWSGTASATYYQARIKKKGSWTAWKTLSQPRVKYSNLKRKTKYKVQIKAGNATGLGDKRAVTKSTR